MFGRNEVSDTELSKTVNSRLSRTGTGSRITATVNRGVVTLLGNLQYAGQRIPIKNTASRISGVRQVIDQMQIARKKPQAAPYQHSKPGEPVKQTETAPLPETVVNDGSPADPTISPNIVES
ncbi:MAG TPA: BON domain-containing protein [Pirellulales bacterium]|nr:BON domain-containing protein [Pirellulales bacterium]